MTAHKILIQNLNSRIENISDSYQIVLRAKDEKRKEKANINFRTEIAFFIHFIKNNYLSRTLFEELLNYNDTLDLSNDYINSIKKTIQLLKQISQLTRGHQDFEKFVVECNDGWKNPFNDSMSIDATKLLERIEKIPEFISSKRISFVNETYEILVAIFKRWKNHFPESDLMTIATVFNV